MCFVFTNTQLLSNHWSGRHCTYLRSQKTIAPLSIISEASGLTVGNVSYPMERYMCVCPPTSTL